MRRDILFSAVPVILALVLGVLLGRIWAIVSVPVPKTVIREDLRPRVPVVMVDAVENGEVRGSMNGFVRVFVGDQAVIPAASGSFRVPAGKIIHADTNAGVPAGMHFVASRKGHKYYGVQSPAAASLSPQNKRYFPDAAAAEAAGYTRAP